MEATKNDLDKASQLGQPWRQESSTPEGTITMTMPTVTIACGQYDTTRALFDGTAAVAGATVQMHTAHTLPEIFAGMMRRHQFDVSELGLTFYLRALEFSPHQLPYVAIPAFPNRVFRHSSVFVHADSGIADPADLVGKTIGEFGIYGQDSGVWAKGALMDDYGFKPGENRWVIGGLDVPAPPLDFVAHPHPADLDVTAAPVGKSLGSMLETGEIDALFTANVPQCVLDGSPHVQRLFPDYEVVERAYFERTGVFPIMHAVVISRDLLNTHPAMGRAVYEAFLTAKDIAAERYRQNLRLYEVNTMVPWMDALVERNAAQFGDDWWPYGMSANRQAIDTYLRYHFEQGLSSRRWTADEIFLPELLGT